MTFELFCATLIAVLFGLAVAFSGYRLFLFLLPIWGFFAGFAIGAQSIQLCSAEASWVMSPAGWSALLLGHCLPYCRTCSTR